MILKGKNVVVTGGGRGIGAAIAHELASEGASLLLGARTLTQVNEVAEAIRSNGGSAWAATCDVTREEDVKAFASTAAEHLGQVDILINNAGMADSAPLKSITLEEWNRMLSVNLTGVMLCTREFLPGMVERKWGRVVNVASIAGVAGAAYISAYAASKHGLMGFTRSVAAEVAKAGVTVNAVCPGYVQTDMTEETVDRIIEKTGLPREKALASIETMNPQGRIIEPEEIAYVTRMLCDDRAKGINGQGVIVDGGSVLS